MDRFIFGLLGIYLFLIIIGWTSLNPTTPQPISEEQAIAFGRVFFQFIDVNVGQVLSVSIEEKQPNYYWGIYVLGLPGPLLDQTIPRECWVVQFEQAHRPGHFVEVWIDTTIPLSVGGMMCLGGMQCR